MKNLKRNFHFLPIGILVLSMLGKIMGILNPSKLPSPELANKLLPVLLLELFCVVLYLIPKTRKYGTWLICSYLGGAIAVSYISSLGNPLMPLFVLGLFFIGLVLNENSAKKSMKQRIYKAKSNNDV
ncbi:MAG: hypothetical protein ACOVP1_12375 [Bacteroidia bacterium]